ADAGAFLNPSLGGLPDPESIPGMVAAVDRLARAAAAGETVWVYTDYDVDGVTSAALLQQFFTECGMPCRVWLPRRDREGYGLHPDALREIAAQGGTLVVTADCGVTAVGPARVARELGLDLVITDHHTPGDELPGAAAVVNPKLPGGTYPDSMIAGVGVAWNLAAAVRRRLRTLGSFGAGRPEPDLKALLDLVALGTVADVVPLRGVNRVLVAAGLAQLNGAPRPGIAALCGVAGVKGDLRAGHIGFQLAPRLNAAGRLHGPQEALDLLAAGDAGSADALARYLDDLNRRRQAEDQAILEAAVARVEGEGWFPGRRSLVVEAEGWNPGVVGIVASRLVERYHRPAVVLSVEGGRAKGSARSVRGLHLHEALGECQSLLTRFGGHAAAAGLELPAERIAAFRERFEAVVGARLTDEALVPVLRLDAEVAFREVELPAVRELGRLEPFGPGNPQPTLLTRGVQVLDIRPIGRDSEHLKFRVEHGGRRLDALAWRKAEGLAYVGRGMDVDLAYSPQVNAWNGRENVQLVVEGMRPATA
ncbi:MAG: single-stranded-DNA-specific exonuclease RecJ, partial [Deferrisomatales bacterium]